MENKFINDKSFEWVNTLAFKPSKGDYYKSWKQVLEVMDRLTIWLEQQKTTIRACRFRNNDKHGHSLHLSERRGEDFASTAMSPLRSWAKIRKLGIDKAMKASLKSTSKRGRKKVFSQREVELHTIAFTFEQNTYNTSLNRYVKDEVFKNPALAGHERTLIRAIKGNCVSTCRTVVPHKKPPKVFYIIYFFLHVGFEPTFFFTRGIRTQIIFFLPLGYLAKATEIR
jgi:hypothetical protein